MKLGKIVVFFVAAFFVLFNPFLPSLTLAQEAVAREETIEGVVIEVRDERDSYQLLEAFVTAGSIEGRRIEVENGGVETTNDVKYKTGDRIVLSYSKGEEGEEFFYITDVVRRRELFILFAIFAALAILVGRKWGLTSILGMGASFVVIFKFVLPQIVLGRDPVLIAILGACVIVPLTFYLSHGFNTKTHVSVLSTCISLVVTGILASIFVTLTRLSGFTTDEASFVVGELGADFNMRGLLLAGIIISSLGILDDITISQASIVSELKSANSKLRFAELFNRSMRVGQDHVASLVNTLVLVYAGASLPLLLLFSNNPMPFGMVINMEIIAEEIVKTLIGSIGLILAVPITSALAAYLFQNRIGVKSSHIH